MNSIIWSIIITKHIKSYGKDSYFQDLIRIFTLTINKIRIVYEEEGERYGKKHQELNCKLAELEGKLSEKRQKYEDVAEQLEKLGLRKVEVQSEYDDLKREINKETDVYYEKIQLRIESFMWKEIAHKR